MTLLFSIFSSWERIVIAFLGIAIIAMGIGLKVRDVKIHSLKSDLNKTKTELLYLQNSLKQNAIAYQDEINRYKNKSPKIVTKYNTVYKEIEDSNATLKNKVFEYVRRMRNETNSTN